MLVVTVGGPLATVLTRRLPRRACWRPDGAGPGAAALSAVAGSYGVLLVARLGSAVAQALFMAVASQVAMAPVPAERQTAAVARVFAGLRPRHGDRPAGRLPRRSGVRLARRVRPRRGARRRAGWSASSCSAHGSRPTPTRDGLGGVVRLVANRPVLDRPRGDAADAHWFCRGVHLRGADAHARCSGFSPGWVSVALVGYGLGTVGGQRARRARPPAAILRVLPVPLAVLTASCWRRVFSCATRPPPLVGLVVLGVSDVRRGPALQTWLMAQVGQAAAGLVAAVNISRRRYRGRARCGSRRRGARRRARPGGDRSDRRAARAERDRVAFGLRRTSRPGAVPGLMTCRAALPWADRRTGGPARMTRPHDDPATEPVTTPHEFDTTRRPRRRLPGRGMARTPPNERAHQGVGRAGAGRARVPGGRLGGPWRGRCGGGARSAAAPTAAGGAGWRRGRRRPGRAGPERQRVGGSGGGRRGAGRWPAHRRRPRRTGWAPGGRRAMRPAQGGATTAPAGPQRRRHIGRGPPANAARPTPAATLPLQAARGPAAAEALTTRAAATAGSTGGSSVWAGSSASRPHRRPPPRRRPRRTRATGRFT